MAPKNKGKLKFLIKFPIKIICKAQKRAHNKKQRGQMKHYLQRVSIEDLEEEFFDDDFDDLVEGEK